MRRSKAGSESWASRSARAAASVENRTVKPAARCCLAEVQPDHRLAETDAALEQDVLAAVDDSSSRRRSISGRSIALKSRQSSMRVGTGDALMVTSPLGVDTCALGVLGMTASLRSNRISPSRAAPVARQRMSAMEIRNQANSIFTASRTDHMSDSVVLDRPGAMRISG